LEAFKNKSPSFFWCRWRQLLKSPYILVYTVHILGPDFCRISVPDVDVHIYTCVCLCVCVCVWVCL
jgi:hypothetical protein